MAESIELTLPVGREWHAVARLVLGGIGDRLNLPFEDLDDLQLAVERLLVEAASQETVRVRVDIVDHGVRVGVGPLAEPAEPPAPGQLACLMSGDAVVGYGTIASAA